MIVIVLVLSGRVHCTGTGTSSSTTGRHDSRSRDHLEQNAEEDFVFELVMAVVYVHAPVRIDQDLLTQLPSSLN